MKKVSASESLYELNRINVCVDGVPIHGFQGIELSRRHKRLVEEELTVPLSNGASKIQVSVVNEKGAESLADTLQVTYSGTPVKPELYLLAVGVSNYEDKSNDLRYAASDALKVERLWRGNPGPFSAVHPLVLVDQNATRDKITAAKAFLAGAGVNDVVVVFLSGHGVLDRNGAYYFGTWDFRARVPSEKGLPYSDIDHLLDGITARRKLVLIDTC
jgi:hypothetical protein